MRAMNLPDRLIDVDTFDKDIASHLPPEQILNMSSSQAIETKWNPIVRLGCSVSREHTFARSFGVSAQLISGSVWDLSVNGKPGISEATTAKQLADACREITSRELELERDLAR